MMIRRLISLWGLIMFAPLSIYAGQVADTRGHSLASNIITIASEPDYPPYCMVDENGQPVGFSVDLFRAAAAAVGLDAKIKIGIWNVIKEDLAAGKIDALPLVGRTPEREAVFDFTMPYLSLHGAVFVRKGTSGIHSLEDLKTKEIVVMKGDNAEEFALREHISDKINTTRTFEEAFKELAAGKHDVVLTQRILGLELLKQLGIKSIEPLDMQLPKFRQDFCFAVQKGNDELLARLNEGLSIIIANDTYEKIKLNWFGPEIKEKLAVKDILTIVLYTLIPLLIIISGLSILFLRKAVKRQTNHLNAEIAGHKNTLARLRENEEQIRLLLNSTAEGIYGIDTNGLCTFINQSALKLLGYADERQVIGVNMHRLIHHTQADGSKCAIESCKIFQAFREGKGIQSADEIFWRADDINFPVEYFSYPIHETGKVTGAVISFQDITERIKSDRELLKLKTSLEVQVEERTAELRQKVKKLDKSEKAMLYMVEDLNRIAAELKNERHKLKLSNEELEAFAYSVSHDLRAPLRAIEGFSRFLEEDYADKLDNEGKRFIATIRQNTAGMDRLISDLLNLSRVSRVEMNPVRVADMGAIARSMYHEFATDEEKKIFELIIDPLPSVSCDVSLIKQVWQNLIGNALKYSARSSVKKIHISGEVKEKEAVFCIRDHGAGFDERYAHKLFGTFQRLHKDDEFEGSGVGLAIVRRSISRHGGRVWAEGRINQGAAFYISLPLE